MAQGEHFFVGKRKGAHSYKQSEINNMLVNFVKDGKQVVRLKGGDVSCLMAPLELEPNNQTCTFYN